MERKTRNNSATSAVEQTPRRVNLGRHRRGRKPASESRTAEIRARLSAWKGTPQSHRFSLRALATEIGASHQLLSFHLRRLDKWQSKECDKKAHEIYDRARAENRSLTEDEQARCVALSRASLRLQIGSVICDTLRQLRKAVKHGKLSVRQVKIVRLLARNGYREAQDILNIHFSGI